LLKNQTRKNIKATKCDGSGEYNSKNLNTFCKENDIVKQQPLDTHKNIMVYLKGRIEHLLKVCDACYNIWSWTIDSRQKQW
jgi:hypothetical protein